MPPVAATLPAVSDDSDVTSSSSTSPASAIGWPSLSMSNTAFAFASRASRAQTSGICCCSSGNITSGPLIALLASPEGSRISFAKPGFKHCTPADRVAR